MNELDLPFLRFRIGAPKTPQRTSLKKYGRSDTRAVMNGKVLYIDNASARC